MFQGLRSVIPTKWATFAGQCMILWCWRGRHLSAAATIDRHLLLSKNWSSHNKKKFWKHYTLHFSNRNRLYKGDLLLEKKTSVKTSKCITKEDNDLCLAVLRTWTPCSVTVVKNSVTNIFTPPLHDDLETVNRAHDHDMVQFYESLTMIYMIVQYNIIPLVIIGLSGFGYVLVWSRFGLCPEFWYPTQSQQW